MGVFGRVSRIAAIVDDAMEHTYAQHGISRAGFSCWRRSGGAVSRSSFSLGALSSALVPRPAGSPAA